MPDTLTRVREKADVVQWRIKHQLDPIPDLNRIFSIRLEAQELVALIERLEYESKERSPYVAE